MVVLEPPFPEIEEHDDSAGDEDEDLNFFSGPSPAELQAEAEKRRLEWESEKTALYNSAKAEADGLLENAKREAGEKTNAAHDEAEAVLAQARDDARKLTEEAESKAASLTAGAQAKYEAERELAHKEGFENGREEGYNSGLAEVKRLIDRTRVVLERVQDKRTEIFAETEQQIIDLALLISRKVIKIISDSEREIVVENIREALGKIKKRGKIIIKVNLQDLELSTARIAEFTSLVEGAGSLQILEDSSVDRGGCVIETDFGEIDARIANQLAELEARILEISPIKGRG
jgi:flagellar assembly protein FliH